MEKIAIYYGSSTGNTKDIAELIAQKLETTHIFDVALAKADFLEYDVLLFGTSTWGIGDLQDDWEGFLNKVESADLTGKKIALFGCGDSVSYSDSFCDAIGKIYKAIKEKGCTIIGKFPIDDYSFDASEAEVGGSFVGLPLDVDNESAQTNSRVNTWVEQLKTEI
ncbi:MAG: flavodoxin FldA [Prevotellaceae bacterium]|jgi:flavodoxin I|nr:flavodoxin FldA [Prevotellaceae bacterium]